MQESQLVNIEALIDKVEKLKEAQPYLNYMVRTKKQLIDIKKPIIDSVRQSIRHISHLVQQSPTNPKDVRRPEAIRQKTEELATPIDINPMSHSYRCAFREYKIEKEQHEKVKKLAQMQENLYAQKIKQINDRINRIELQYDPLEWKHIPDEKLQFSDAKEMLSDYLTLFENQIKKKIKKADFQNSLSNFVDEYEMRNRIFNDLSSCEAGQYVNKDNLIKFLRDHPYFMLYFNIDQEMLESQVKYFNEKSTLSRQQFHIFLNQPRKIPNNLDKTSEQQRYVLDQQNQEILHNIYRRLDTYGRNQVARLKLVQYINHNKEKLKRTLFADVIYFPEVDRSYCLAKILRDFQYYEKYNIISWDEFRAYLKNYKLSVDRPTINIIEQKKVLRGELSGEYLHLLGKDFLDFIIKCFNRCRRHSHYFVSKTEFVSTMIGDLQYPNYSDAMTRMEDCKGIPRQSVADTLQRIKKGLNFVDLDEIIEFFSYRGRPSYQPTGLLKPQDFEMQSDSQTQSILRVVKSASNKRKHNRQKKEVSSSFRNLRRMKITVPEEFNLNQNDSKASIRNRRLQEMLKAKEQLEELELNFKFKSKPIPKSTYFVAIKTENKEKSKSQDINYLPLRFLVNPQFFRHRNPEDKKQHCQISKEDCRVEKRQPPKNIKDSRMLEKIEERNEQRRYQIFEKARKMYESRPLSPEMQRLLQKKDQPTEEPLRKIKIKPTPIPDFKKLHQEMEKSRSKKAHVTEIQEFNLSKPAVRSKSKEPSLVKSSSEPKDIQAIIDNMKMPIQLPITKKYESMVKKRKQDEKTKMKRLEFLQKQDQERAKKRKEFAKFMFRNHSQASTKKILEWQTQQKISQYRQRQERLAIQTQNQIAEIYRRVLSRPFLYQGSKEGKTTIKRKTRHEMPVHAPKKNVRTNKPEQRPLLRQVKEQEIRDNPVKDFSDLEEDQSQEIEPQKEFPGVPQQIAPTPYAFFNEEDDESEPYYDEKNHSF